MSSLQIYKEWRGLSALSLPLNSHRASWTFRILCSGAVWLALSGTAEAPWAGPLSPAFSAFKDTGAAHGNRAIPVQADAADFQVTNVSGPAGKPIPLPIKISGLNDKNAGQLFLFTGVPEGVKLNPGGYFGDFWAVTSKDLAGLTLTAPDNFSGVFQMKITRTRSPSISARSATVTVTIGDAGTAQAAAAPVTPAPAADPNPNEQMLLTRATELFKKGDVSGARVIFEYLALKGSPRAAVAMGETYDPLILEKLFIQGLESNAAKAQEWYQKAESLGSGEARTRLNALATR